MLVTWPYPLNGYRATEFVPSRAFHDHELCRAVSGSVTSEVRIAKRLRG